MSVDDSTPEEELEGISTTLTESAIHQSYQEYDNSAPAAGPLVTEDVVVPQIKQDDQIAVAGDFASRLETLDEQQTQAPSKPQV